MTVTVTDGRETQAVVRGVDGDGVEHTEEVLYRELVVRQALAGQGMSGYGMLPVSTEGDRVAGAGFRLRSESAEQLVTWAYEEASDGGLTFWVWTTTDGEARWSVPEGWAGEAPIATSMPWLRVSR